MKLIGCYTGTEYWNPSEDPWTNQQWEAGVHAFESAVGQPVNMYNIFPCWGTMDYWGWNTNSLVRGIAMSGFGTALIPVIGLKLISYGAPPENYGWNDANGYRNVANGVHDPMLWHVIDVCAESGFSRLIIRLSYEYNGSFMQDFEGFDQPTMDAWRAGFEHAAAVLKQRAGERGIHLDIALNPCLMAESGAVEPNLPDMTNVSIFAIDAYNSYWGHGDINDPAERRNFWDNTVGSRPYGMLSHIGLAKKLNKPVLICECGGGASASGPEHGVHDDPAWWPWLAERVAAMRAEGVGYYGLLAWDINPGDGFWRFTDGSQPTCLTHFRQHLSTFMSDEIGETPPITPPAAREPIGPLIFPETLPTSDPQEFGAVFLRDNQLYASAGTAQRRPLHWERRDREPLLACRRIPARPVREPRRSTRAPSRTLA